MTHKMIWLPAFIIAFCMANTMQAITYPTKSALKKADHIASLAISATFISICIASERKDALLYAHLIALGTNSIVNGMALKHDRSLGTILKFLLPTGILGGYTAWLKADENSNLEGAGLLVFIVGHGVNGIKNIWDVYSLIKYSQSERTQHDA